MAQSYCNDRGMRLATASPSGVTRKLLVQQGNSRQMRRRQGGFKKHNLEQVSKDSQYSDATYRYSRDAFDLFSSDSLLRVSAV
jgi:hypothetical protein